MALAAGGREWDPNELVNDAGGRAGCIVGGVSESVGVDDGTDMEKNARDGGALSTWSEQSKPNALDDVRKPATCTGGWRSGVMVVTAGCAHAAHSSTNRDSTDAEE